MKNAYVKLVEDFNLREKEDEEKPDVDAFEPEADKPVEKPADKPKVNKPVDKPKAEKPAEEPKKEETPEEPKEGRLAGHLSDKEKNAFIQWITKDEQVKENESLATALVNLR
jgi:outer membrane biosynthesis protein TonB